MGRKSRSVGQAFVDPVGSVREFHGPRFDGYVVSIRINGKRTQKYVAGVTPASLQKAEATLNELRNQRLYTMLPTKGPLTVGEFFTGKGDDFPGWLKDREGTKAYHTLKTDRGVVNKYLIPRLGKLPLKGLASDHIQRLLIDPLKTDVSARRLHNIRAILRNALEDAVAKGLIEKNPAMGKRSLTMPRLPQKEAVPWGKVERGRFLEAIKGHPLEPLFLTLYWHGLRIEEALGLSWDDINFSGRTLYIHRTLQWHKTGKDKQQPVLSSEMKVSNPRTVRLHPAVATALQTLERPKRPKTTLDNLIFRNGGGRPMQDNTVRRKLDDILNEAELPAITLHDFRDMTVVRMAESAVPIHYTSKFVGHKNIATTLKWYAVASQKDLNDVLDRYFDRGVYVPNGDH